MKKFPDFEMKIKPILDQKYSSYEGVNKIIDSYQHHQETNSINKLRPIDRFRIAVEKLILIGNIE